MLIASHVKTITIYQALLASNVHCLVIIVLTIVQNVHHAPILVIKQFKLINASVRMDIIWTLIIIASNALILVQNV